jgi:beta-galactosidase
MKHPQNLLRTANIISASTFLTALGVLGVASCGSDTPTAPRDETYRPRDATPDTLADEPVGDAAVSDVRVRPTGRFPSKFLFGTAIAGFQADMGCPTLPTSLCEDVNSDWYQWITTPRIVNNPLLFMSGDLPSTGPGFFELYPQDLQRAAGHGDAELANETLRFSFEWSRIFPRPTFGISSFADLKAKADPNALRYYHDLLREMRRKGLKPNATVHHYSLPLWIHDGNLCNDSVIPGLGLTNCIRAGKAGWANPNRTIIVDEIAKYAGFLAKEFGDEIDLWATENEPFSAVVVAGYLIASQSRSNPPGLSGTHMSVSGAKTALLAMIEAHAKMYDAIKANDLQDADGDGAPAQVGIVYAFSKLEPLTSTPGDAEATRNADYIFHDLFMQAITEGRVDPDWSLGPGKGMVRNELRGKLDWLGVNYYFRFRAQNSIAPLPFISPFITFNMLQPFDEEHPQGLEAALAKAASYGLPLYVTETGTRQNDERRGAAWFVRSVEETRKAIERGIDIRGFYAWTLTDNYEWNHGMNMRMGLYGVDINTKRRTPREAAFAYGEMARSRDVSPSIFARYVDVFAP